MVNFLTDGGLTATVNPMKARVPASTANLGPGFDTLALALSLYLEVTIEPADKLHITTEGVGADLPCDENHLAVKVASLVASTDKLRIHVKSEIPLGRGLGSSGALAAAAAAAAGSEDPYRVAVEWDDAPDNAGASVFGGLIATTMTSSGPLAKRLPLDPQLAVIAVVPDIQLLTADARSVLPDTVTREDAVFNLSRMGVLLSGLADCSQLVPVAFEDRLHQPYRSALFPAASDLIEGLTRLGALGACWSGAGSTIVAFCRRESQAELGDRAKSLVDELDVAGDVLSLVPDMAGLTLEA